MYRSSLSSLSSLSSCLSPCRPLWPCLSSLCSWACAIGGLGWTGLASAAEAPPPAQPALEAFWEDDVLQDLVQQALSARPELLQARAQIDADRERIPQTRTLADPLLSFGIQNDGFTHIQIGKMETSWISIMASQSFPWFGKRDLRAGVAESQARRGEGDLERARLSMEAEMARAYLDLLAVRDEAGLLTRMETLWSQSETIARVRYEAGDGVQSDLMRAQLERNRLRQQRLLVHAEETRRGQVLDRLRGVPAGGPIATTRHLTDLADPVVPELGQAIAEALERSPELHRAATDNQQATRQLALSEKDSYPDIVVSAGLMPRGGSFETMWVAGVSLNVPVWSIAKRSHALAEGRARARAVSAGAESIRCFLEQRVRERHTLLTALVESNRIYRSGLLVQSDATVSSTVTQYRVGKVPLASVLEAMGGYVADVNGFFQSIVQAQRLAIALREISLADADGGLPSLPGGGGMGGTPAGGVGRPPGSGPGTTARDSGSDGGATAGMGKM